MIRNWGKYWGTRGCVGLLPTVALLACGGERPNFVDSGSTQSDKTDSTSSDDGTTSGSKPDPDTEESDGGTRTRPDREQESAVEPTNSTGGTGGGTTTAAAPSGTSASTGSEATTAAPTTTTVAPTVSPVAPVSPTTDSPDPATTNPSTTTPDESETTSEPECTSNDDRKCSGDVAVECQDGKWTEVEMCGFGCTGAGVCTGLCDAVTCVAPMCKVAGTCNETTGSCSSPTNAENGSDCDDGNLCTQTDSCASGSCVGSNPVVCPAPDVCNVIGVCDSGTGHCSLTTHAPNDSSCDDGDPCTESDKCHSGLCDGTAKACDNPPACKQETTCSEGECNYTQNVPDGETDEACPNAGQKVCSGGACVQCVDDGACSGTTPSCNTTSKQCVCRLKSTGNLLPNPGFDGVTTGWSNVTLTADAENCSQSNAAHLQGTGDSAVTLLCVQLGGASTYFFGGKFKDGGSQSQFSLSFWDSTTCNGTQVGSRSSLFPNASAAQWTPASKSVAVPTGAVALKIEGVVLSMYMDQVYLNATNQY